MEELPTIEAFGAQKYVGSFFDFLPPNLRSLISYQRGFETLDLSKPVYIYTGRGPSKAAFHIGHLPALKLCLALQAYFKTTIQFMIADDEKIFRDGISRDQMTENVSETIRQLSQIGFNETNTHFRINSTGIKAEEYELVMKMLGSISVHTLTSIFGEKSNLGEYFYPLIQVLPCFSKSSQCIVIAGIDQDPFFRLARGLARKMGFAPPIVLYTHSVPGLDGSEKMSTSVLDSNPIFLGESASSVAKKVSKIRKVGAGSLDELFARGANLEIDIPYRLLTFFDESENLPLIAKAYTFGLTDPCEVAQLNELVGETGIKSQNGRTMLTSSGIRQYLTTILIEVVTLETL